VHRTYPQAHLANYPSPVQLSELDRRFSVGPERTDRWAWATTITVKVVGETAQANERFN